MTSYKCQICQKDFASERALHMHVIKAHKATLQEYYYEFFPRKNLLTGKIIPFKNKKDYFSRDFSNRSQLIEWCSTCESKTVADYIRRVLQKRIKDKKLSFAPSHLEIEVNKLPPIDIYKSIFGGYGQACKQVGVEPLFPAGIVKNALNKKFDTKNMLIFIDTREQKPLSFSNSRDLKLDFGDYTAGEKFYTKTYVDRKSEGDFKTTLSKFNLNRFRAELQRAKDFDSYLYIVVESSLEKITVNNNFGAHKSNLNYIFHNMRVLQHEFRGHCQFVFSGSRKKSEAIIPKLLFCGKNLWEVDIQYCIDQDGIDC
jgi:hypothetical protein